MITVTLRLEDALKKDLDEMCEEMGMSLTTFFMIYARTAVRERCIPFIIRTDKAIYSESNLKHLQKSLEEAQQGNIVTKTLEDLKEMEG